MTVSHRLSVAANVGISAAFLLPKRWGQRVDRRPQSKPRKNRHHPNNPYSFTNCLTDTIHKIVSMRSVRRYVTTTSELSGNEKASQNFGF